MGLRPGGGGAGSGRFSPGATAPGLKVGLEVGVASRWSFVTYKAPIPAPTATILRMVINAPMGNDRGRLGDSFGNTVPQEGQLTEVARSGTVTVKTWEHSPQRRARVVIGLAPEGDRIIRIQRVYRIMSEPR